MNFLILADKYVRGTKPKICPGLIPSGFYENIFQNQYKVIKDSFKKSKIIYLYGFDHKKMDMFIEQNNKRNKYCDVVFLQNANYNQFNYGYSLSLLNEFMNTDFFIMFGETIITPSLFKNFNKKNGTQIYINQKQKNKIGCIINEENTIDNICFDLENYLMNIFYISKKDCEILQELLSSDIYRNYFIFEIINEMIKIGVNINPIFRNRSSTRKNKVIKK